MPSKPGIAFVEFETEMQASWAGCEQIRRAGGNALVEVSAELTRDAFIWQLGAALQACSLVCGELQQCL